MPREELPPITPDPVIEVYKKDVDRTLLRENRTRARDENASFLWKRLGAAGMMLRALSEARIRFIVIGEVAAMLHGSAQGKGDLEIVYDRSPMNQARLLRMLTPLRPRLLGASAGFPFVFDKDTLRDGLNFELVCDWGPIYLRGEIVGGGGYADLLPYAAVSTEPKCRVLGLERLIQVKRAAGRPSDFPLLADLEVLREEFSVGGHGLGA